MAHERFPEQHEQDRAGGQHGTRNTDGGHAGRGAKEDELSHEQPSRDPQLRRVHEEAKSPPLPQRNDVPLEHGGARHRQQ